MSCPRWKSKTKMKKLLLFFLLSYLISWLIWLPLILPSYGINTLPVLPKYHHYLGSFGPMLAAIIIKYFSDGNTGVKQLLKRLAQWNVGIKWYFVVLVAPVLLVLAAGAAVQFFNGQRFNMNGFATNDEFPQFGPLGYFLFNLFTFGIGEETGWRGYALPALQKKFSALTSALMLTVIWFCWHIPSFLYRPIYSQMDVSGIAGFFMSLAMGSILLTWIFNSTKGSLLLVSIFHAMVEIIFMSKNITLQISSYEGAAFMITAILIIVITKPIQLSFTERQKELQ